MGRIFHWTLLILPLAVSPAQAEGCAEKFVRLLKATQEATVPKKNLVVTEMKNAPTMTNEHYWISPEHNMTAMIDPPGPWMLIYKNAMYTSMDKGETWSKLRDTDQSETESHIEALAATVQNAECAEADLDGETYDTVEADYSMGEGENLTEVHDKYWVRRGDEFIPRSETTMKRESIGFESFVTQNIENVPDLTLPTPE